MMSESPRRRQEILEAARDVFLEKGFEAATTREIGARAGILKGSLYHYINSKDDLLFELLQETHTKAMALLEELRSDRSGTPEERLARFVERFVRHQVTNSLDAQLFDREMRSLEPQRRLEISEGFERMFWSLLTKGQREGAFDPGLDPVVTSKSVLLMLNHLYVWYSPAGRIGVEELVSDYVRLVQNALGVHNRAIGEQAGQ